MDGEPTVSRRTVLGGIAGAGMAATGVVPTVAGADTDVVRLGDFESGLDGWESPESRLEPISRSAYPGAVTRGDRGLEVTVIDTLLPTIGNDARVREADFLGHPYFIADVTPEPIAGLDTTLTFKLRYYHSDDPDHALDGDGLGDVAGIEESDEQTVPPGVPSRLVWDMSGLPDEARTDPRRFEIVWYPTALGVGSLGVDYRAAVVFDNIRLSARVDDLGRARLQNIWRDLHLAHGPYLETVVSSSGPDAEAGVFVFQDGTEVPYAFEVLAEGQFRYTIDGQGLRLAATGDVSVTPGTGESQAPSSLAGQRTATATALTYIPGTSENTTDGGDEYDSAMPDVSDHIDNAFHADNHTSLEPTLGAATAVDKDLAEYPDRLFPHYRVRNGIAVSFPSTASGDIDGEVHVTSAEHSDLAPITLEGEDGEGDDNPYRANLDSIHGGEEWKDALSREHFVSHTSVDVGGIEGVRASTIYGGVDRYIAEYIDALSDGGQLNLDAATAETPVPYVLDHMLALPAFYTFLEVTEMADGTSVARVWDAGHYPRHALYLDGDRRGESDFERGEEWWRNEPMNARFARWGSESKLALHPYKSPHLAYKRLFWAGGGPHPVIVTGDDGSVLTAREVIDATPRPHFPF